MVPRSCKNAVIYSRRTGNQLTILEWKANGGSGFDSDIVPLESFFENASSYECREQPILLKNCDERHKITN